jgi:hypothetical protein
MAKATLTLLDLPNDRCLLSVNFYPSAKGGRVDMINSPAVLQAMRIMNESFRGSGVQMRATSDGFEICGMGNQPCS